MIPRYLALLTLSLCVATHAFPRRDDTTVIRRDRGILINKNVRFQFLSHSLIRMEYSPSAAFVDVPSAVVSNRSWATIGVTVKREDGWLVVTTGRLTLKYALNSGPFAPTNLRVSWNIGGREQSWVPGSADSLNLGGMSRSLDGARKGRMPIAEPGLLSRSGYFLLDDSRTPVWDHSSQWITPRAEKGVQDWYLFVYGHDYPLALKEFTELCGKIPMVPRYTFGGWITDLNYEYLPGTDVVEKFRYSDEDIKTMVERFRVSGIPLDVLVLDFAWHRYGWKGGYDWSPIFPNPQAFLTWAHGQGLKVSLNDHPGYGRESVLSDEDSHAGEIRRILHIPPPRKPTFTQDIRQDWKFMLDSTGIGTDQRWYSTTLDDHAWKRVQAGTSWEEQGYPQYDGVAWYRKRVLVPSTTPAGKLYLVFGGVDDEYDLFINGTQVAHYGVPGSSVYNSPTATDVSAYVKRGEESVITLRVNDWGGDGGISASPVAITDVPPAEGIRFNLADKHHADAFMNTLHNPLIDQGVDFWWVDGGSGSSDMEGLNSQMWTNHVFYQFTEEHTKERAFLFSRYGGWGNHRYPSVFTGDTYSEWDVLAHEVPFTARGGNALVPYITHDIGGFLGKKLDFALYARWVQFGVFGPILRLHCAFENPQDGNLRLPWIYGDRGVEFVREMFRLRYRLLPYIYSYSRVSHDTGLPIVRPLYLEHPDLEAAYAHPDEYFFGKELLVAPIVDPTNERNVYLPPGQWSDFFSGERYHGNTTIHVSCPLERMPVYVKSGSILPQQHIHESNGQRALDTLIVEIYGPDSGTSELYEDDGISLDYRDGKVAWTPLALTLEKGNGYRITVGPTRGEFKGQLEQRAISLVAHGFARPREVTVNGRTLVAGKAGPSGWVWDATKEAIVVTAGLHPIRKPLEVWVR